MWSLEVERESPKTNLAQLPSSMWSAADRSTETSAGRGAVRSALARIGGGADASRSTATKRNIAPSFFGDEPTVRDQEWCGAPSLSVPHRKDCKDYFIRVALHCVLPALPSIELPFTFAIYCVPPAVKLI